MTLGGPALIAVEPVFTPRLIYSVHSEAIRRGGGLNIKRLLFGVLLESQTGGKHFPFDKWDELKCLPALFNLHYDKWSRVLTSHLRKFQHHARISDSLAET